MEKDAGTGRKNMEIRIVFKNGETCTWDRESYTDYKYDGKCFIVIRDGKWIAFYNVDEVVCITTE